MRDHYHVRAGKYGCQPYANEMVSTRHVALERLSWHVFRGYEIHPRQSTKEQRYSGWVQHHSVHFRLGYGKGYVEVVGCGDWICSLLQPDSFHLDTRVGVGSIPSREPTSLVVE